MTHQIGYIVNTYPRPSHSFIRREIAALEKSGLIIHRFAMRGDFDMLTDPDDLAEHDRTERILERGARGLLAALMRRAGPDRRGLAAALRVARARAAAGESSFARQIIYLAEGARILERSRELGLTHLHAHFGTNSARVASYTRLLGGPEFSFTVHGPEEFDHPQQLDLGGKLAAARFAVTVSSFGRSQLSRWAAPSDLDKIRVVHCGLDFAAGPPAAPLPPGPLHLVAVGRFAEQKGFGLLIDAFIQALGQNPSIRLTLVGDGELRPQIAAKIAAHGAAHAVHLPGWQDQAGVSAQMRAAHVLIAPSFAEGLPVVIMEAMAQARPVISTYIAGIPELVRPGTDGWLVPAGDRAALAGAILNAAAQDDATLARMGLSAHQRVRERHDIAVSAQRLARLFTRSTG